MTADSVVCICLHAECENDEIAELANERENCNDASDPGISVHLCLLFMFLLNNVA